MKQPGYYLHIEYGNLMLGGGAYFLEKEPLERVRSAIALAPQTFRSLIEAPDFVQKFGEIKGEANKVLPPAFKEAARAEPLIANKQFYFMAETDPEMVLRPDFPDVALDYFRAGHALNQYLRAALATN